MFVNLKIDIQKHIFGCDFMFNPKEKQFASVMIIITLILSYIYFECININIINRIPFLIICIAKHVLFEC